MQVWGLLTTRGFSMRDLWELLFCPAHGIIPYYFACGAGAGAGVGGCLAAVWWRVRRAVSYGVEETAREERAKVV